MSNIIHNVVNLKDIDKCEIRGLLSEMLFNEGLCIIEMHKEYFFSECEHHKDYKVMHEVDVEIIFQDCEVDPDFPISMSYRTILDSEPHRLDLITNDLYRTLIVKENE